MVLTPIETERLKIERATLDDHAFILELLNSSTWIEFIGDRGIKTEEDAKQYIQGNLIESYRKNGFGLFKICLKPTNIPIGLCGFVKRDFLNSVDIGYALLPEFEGKGLAYEAARATLNYGLSNLKLAPILAITSKENKRSHKLLHKLGLSNQGTIPIDDKNSQVLLFST